MCNIAGLMQVAYVGPRGGDGVGLFCLSFFFILEKLYSACSEECSDRVRDASIFANFANKICYIARCPVPAGVRRSHCRHLLMARRVTKSLRYSKQDTCKGRTAWTQLVLHPCFQLMDASWHYQTDRSLNSPCLLCPFCECEDTALLSLLLKCYSVCHQRWIKCSEWM